MLCWGRGDRLAQTDHGEGAEEVCPGVGVGGGRKGALGLPEGQGSRKQKRLVSGVGILSWVGHNSALFPLLPTLGWEIFKGSGPAHVEHLLHARAMKWGAITTPLFCPGAYGHI